jgi:protein tyrosine phosphatase (PTP) superfamily phosphohydrolase (DUF442 family)
MSTEEIYNVIRVNDQIITSGQPTEDQVKAAASEGFANVINLAPHSSRGALPDEAGLVRSLSMTYCYVPVNWSKPTEADFAAFEKAMNDHKGEKTLIHCQANYRVTAFYSLYAQKNLGWSQAEAEAFRGKIWAAGDDPTWYDFIDEMTAKITGK